MHEDRTKTLSIRYVDEQGNDAPSYVVLEEVEFPSLGLRLPKKRGQPILQVVTGGKLPKGS